VYLTVNVWLVSARAGWGVTTTDTGVMKPKGKVADAWAVTCPLKP
jgi:hypothetical protein